MELIIVADDFLRSYVDSSVEPVVVISHGHFSRILAARALGRTADTGCLFASATASVSVVKDYHRERCIGLWNASADLVDDVIGRARPTGKAPSAGEGTFLSRDSAAAAPVGADALSPPTATNGAAAVTSPN